MKNIIYKIDKPGKIVINKVSYNENTVLVTITPSKYRVICNGIDFQEFVWGGERISLWIVDREQIKCYVDKYVLQPIIENIYYVSRKDTYSIPDTILNKLSYVKEIIQELEKDTGFEKFFIMPSDKDLIQDNFIYVKSS